MTLAQVWNHSVSLKSTSSLLTLTHWVCHSSDAVTCFVGCFLLFYQGFWAAITAELNICLHMFSSTALFHCWDPNLQQQQLWIEGNTLQSKQWNVNYISFTGSCKSWIQEWVFLSSALCQDMWALLLSSSPVTQSGSGGPCKPKMSPIHKNIKVGVKGMVPDSSQRCPVTGKEQCP